MPPSRAPVPPEQTKKSPELLKKTPRLEAPGRRQGAYFLNPKLNLPLRYPSTLQYPLLFY